MDHHQIISELNKELNKEHVGGRAGRVAELTIGLFLLAGGILNLAGLQGFIRGVSLTDITAPQRLFWASVTFVILGCCAVSRFLFYMKWKRAIARIGMQI